MSIYMENDNINKFIEHTLNEMRAYVPDYHSCFHCGHPVRYPLIARQSDIDMFKTLIDSAESVLTEHGVKQKLLDDIRRKAILSLLSRKPEPSK